jgi:hypothetical protein
LGAHRPLRRLSEQIAPRVNQLNARWRRALWTLVHDQYSLGIRRSECSRSERADFALPGLRLGSRKCDVDDDLRYAGLDHRAGLEPALRALDRIDASPSVTVRFATTGDHAEGRRWLERLAPRPITYTDAVSFAVMAAAKCKQVLGFDEDFAAAGFELWRGL